MSRALFAISILALSWPAEAQTVRGVVIDVEAAYPLPRTQVVVTRKGDTLGVAQTDSGGAFEMSVRNTDSLVAHFRRIGYVADSTPFTTPELPLRVAMNRVLTLASLPLVTVRAAATEFDRRAARSAGGHFMNLAQIDSAHPNTTSDLLRRLPGFTIFTDADGVLQVLSQRTNRINQPNRATIEAARNSPLGKSAPGSASGDAIGSDPKSGGYLCAMRIVIDGVLMPDGFSIDDIRPADIYGLEIYSGPAAVPIQYSTVRRDAVCGLLMVWTKAGRDRP